MLPSKLIKVGILSLWSVHRNISIALVQQFDLSSLSYLLKIHVLMMFFGLGL